MTDTTTEHEAEGPGLNTVVAASAAGTAFEWYDFFIFGSLTTIIARHFYADVGEATAYILALLTFGVGFVVRPLGALVFGWFGDRTGRKTTFLVTITLMGLATVAIGLLPDYNQAGIVAPILLILMRIIQGFALGGEYGGAAIYVAEHAPPKTRGPADQLHPDHRRPGSDRRAGGDPDHPRHPRDRGLRRLGLAHPVLALGPVAGRVAVDPRPSCTRAPPS